MRKGAFIVFEGIDGSGKSSCMDEVASALLRERIKVIKTSEPTKGEIGAILRTSGNRTPEAEALLFTADRAVHTCEIVKWVESGKTVLCDRYYASTIAYQSASLNGRSADADWLTAINDEVIIEPDMTLLFDIDPELSMGRVESRGRRSRFERPEYLREVRNNYLRIAKLRNFKVIDASRPKEEVLEDVLRRVREITG
ncbi:MAG: dTMP kinase [Methanomassiliicoccaceae archaeon]|nr:dTMP kinase [Methanomassiliicoccaceae archaeon]